MSWSPQRKDLCELPREAEACFLESVDARVWCQDEMILIPVSNESGAVLPRQKEEKACQCHSLGTVVTKSK